MSEPMRTVVDEQRTYEIYPQIMAEVAIRAMILAREGARALKTPIWMPNEPRFANPQSA